MATFLGWDSLETVSTVHTWAEILGIVFLGLLVVAEVIAFCYGHRKDELIKGNERVRTEEANQELAELRRQLPRRLSDEQKQILIDVLSPFRGQKVSINGILGNDEGRDLVEDFKDVFARARWDLGGDSGVSRNIYTKDPIGIAIHLNKHEVEAGRIPQSAVVLGETLIQIGLLDQRAFLKDEKTPVGEIELRIGWKP